jgi:hypothetical protein
MVLSIPLYHPILLAVEIRYNIRHIQFSVFIEIQGVLFFGCDGFPANNHIPDDVLRESLFDFD